MTSGEHMLLLLILLTAFSLAITIRMFAKSVSIYSLPNNIFTVLPVQSRLHCALCCETDDVSCTRFLFDDVRHICMLHSDDVSEVTQPLYTTGTLYLAAVKECRPPDYDYDVLSETCFKFYDIVKTWAEARSQCQHDGADLISLTTSAKFNLVADVLKAATTKTFWIGMVNGTWLTEETFEYVYSIDAGDIVLDWVTNDDGCGGIELEPGKPVITDQLCTKGRRFICEYKL